MEAIVLMEGGALGGGVSTPNVPVDAQGLVVGGGKAKTWATFHPNDLTVNGFCGRRGFKVEEDGVPSLCTDEADGGGGRLAAA